MKGILRVLVVVAVLGLMAAWGLPDAPGITGKHFESRCDTLTRGTDTIVNCYVRCANPPRAGDTISPNGDFMFIEATVTWSASIDTVKFQTLDKFSNTWSDIGAYDLNADDVPYGLLFYNAAAEKRRFRMCCPGLLKVRAILTEPASYSVRSVHVVWEGYTESN